MIYGKVKTQLYNVTIFFLFISTFFSILGIQIFSKPEHRCFRSKEIVNLTSRDLAVPDALCSNENHGNHCPSNMFCGELKNIKNVHLEYQYNNLINAFFTTYKAASQEDWATLMYEKLDQMPAYEPILFYISLIFFLSWLVKNLFIAVVTQSFELIRYPFFLLLIYDSCFSRSIRLTNQSSFLFQKSTPFPEFLVNHLESGGRRKWGVEQRIQTGQKLEPVQRGVGLQESFHLEKIKSTLSVVGLQLPCDWSNSNRIHYHCVHRFQRYVRSGLSDWMA